MQLAGATAVLKAVLDAMPGAIGQPMTASRGSRPLVLIYKIHGKMFAILGVRDEAFVVLKCDPFRAELLREQYRAVGHRSHLDRRFWISIDLESDLSMAEVETLIRHSWEQVAATLTGKQRAELAARAEGT